MLGLKKGHIKLVPHKKAWAGLFSKEKKQIEKKLEGISLGVEHIGSTSIPGIEAKPVIDILVGVLRVKDSKKCIVPLKKIGYKNLKDRGNPRTRLFFRKGDSIHSTHHLHVVKFGGKIWKKHTAFPRYLRTHRSWAKKYEALKKQSALKFKQNKENYTTSKGRFIEKVIKIATK